MASNLAGGGDCLFQHSVCLLRAAALDSDCVPVGGSDSGIVTLGIVSLTATPEVEEGRVFEPKNGCGRIMATYEEPDTIKRWNLTGELSYTDLEMKYLLFGGELVTGHASASDFPNTIVGYGYPHFTDAASNGVYLEAITRLGSSEAGECAASGSTTPYAQGFIFGKTKLTPGDITLEDAAATVPFTGVVSANPNLFNGPWNDYPGAGYIPNRAVSTVMYSRDEYDAIAAVARCGFQTLPAAS